jgi:hypothetical protein
MLDRALEELGLDRRRMYVTNAVKHFKFERRGKVRLHKSPNPAEQRACRLWLEGEIERIRPMVVVCLGAIAGPAAPGQIYQHNRPITAAHPAEIGNKIGEIAHIALEACEANQRHFPPLQRRGDMHSRLDPRIARRDHLDWKCRKRLVVRRHDALLAQMNSPRARFVAFCARGWRSQSSPDVFEPQLFPSMKQGAPTAL